jgi:hypothetical protein
MKASGQHITTVNSKKEGGEDQCRHNVQELLKLNLKLTQAKCQLNIDIVSDKHH